MRVEDNTVRMHAGISGPDDEDEAEEADLARPNAKACAPHGKRASPTVDGSHEAGSARSTWEWSIERSIGSRPNLTLHPTARFARGG